MKKEYEKAPLWRHVKVFHAGVKNPEWFDMKVQKTHRTPLCRQIAEGVEINLCQADVILNSKGEWNGSRLPRMLVERGEQVELDENDVNVRTMNWERMSGTKNEMRILEGTKTTKRKKSEQEDLEVEQANEQEEQVSKKRRVDSNKQEEDVQEVQRREKTTFGNQRESQT